MNRLLSAFGTFLLVCVLSGCASTQVMYSANPSANRDEARSKLTQLLRQNEDERVPLQDVEVNPDFFKCAYVETQHVRWSATKITVPYTKFVYFNNVDRIAVYKRKSMWRVLLGDSTHAELFWFQTNQEANARAFVDSVVTLGGLDPSISAKAWKAN